MSVVTKPAHGSRETIGWGDNQDIPRRASSNVAARWAISTVPLIEGLNTRSQRLSAARLNGCSHRRSRRVRDKGARLYGVRHRGSSPPAWIRNVHLAPCLKEWRVRASSSKADPLRQHKLMSSSHTHTDDVSHSHFERMVKRGLLEHARHLLQRGSAKPNRYDTALTKRELDLGPNASKKTDHDLSRDPF